jgi:hypothetical protein
MSTTNDIQLATTYATVLKRAAEMQREVSFALKKRATLPAESLTPSPSPRPASFLAAAFFSSSHSQSDASARPLTPSGTKKGATSGSLQCHPLLTARGRRRRCDGNSHEAADKYLVRNRTGKVCVLLHGKFRDLLAIPIDHSGEW